MFQSGWTYTTPRKIEPLDTFENTEEQSSVWGLARALQHLRDGFPLIRFAKTYTYAHQLILYTPCAARRALCLFTHAS
ncbi:MAG: hypothetical protein CMO26_22595 [Thiotrichales bacterium]|nr:hypothetical protein [Thiotrichales bacterium]